MGEGRRSPADLTTVWRALGAPLDGRGPLRRGRLQRRRPPGSHRKVSLRLPLSRLADPRAQRRHVLRHVHQDADCRRPARPEGARQEPPRARHERQRYLGVPGQPGADRACRRVARQGGRDEQGVHGPHRRLAPAATTTSTTPSIRRTTTGWRACSPAPLQVVPAGAEGGSRRLGEGEQGSREEERGAQEVPRRELGALRAGAVLAGRGLHAGGLEARHREEGDDRRHRRRREGRSRAAGAVGEVPQEAARQLFGTQAVAGAGSERRQGRRGQEAREGVPRQGRGDQREAGQAGEGERGHAGPVQELRRLLRSAAERQEAPAERLSDRPEEPGARREHALARHVRTGHPGGDRRRRSGSAATQARTAQAQ